MSENGYIVPPHSIRQTFHLCTDGRFRPMAGLAVLRRKCGLSSQVRQALAAPPSQRVLGLLELLYTQRLCGGEVGLTAVRLGALATPAWRTSGGLPMASMTTRFGVAVVRPAVLCESDKLSPFLPGCMVDSLSCRKARRESSQESKVIAPDQQQFV